MDVQAVEAWVEGYVRAWQTNDPEDIGRLFTQDARYYTAPYRKPWAGRDAILSGWIGQKDEQGTWEFRYEVLGVTDALAFVRGWTKYLNSGTEYSNLWVIRLDQPGRCSEFIEWWMEHEPIK